MVAGRGRPDDRAPGSGSRSYGAQVKSWVDRSASVGSRQALGYSIAQQSLRPDAGTLYQERAPRSRRVWTGVHLGAVANIAAVPASRYVHPRAAGADGVSDYSLDIAEDPSTNYVRWIADLCTPHLGETVLDFGAGFGAITSHIAPGRSVTALDSSAACAAALRERFAPNSNVSVVQGDLSDLADRLFDSVLITNVLEHILDDAGLLADLATHLRPGGNVVIYVPAFNPLFTGWDRKVGHYRRYSRRRLAGVVREGGLRTTQMHYVNLLALPAWLVSGRLVDRQDRTVRSLGLWDRRAVPIARAIESRFHPPIGLNLFCVAARD